METNMICAQYCIDVIRAVMQEWEVPEIPEGVTLRALFDFSKMHSVEAMVFYGLGQLGMEENDPVWQFWRNRAEMILTQSIVQLADRDALFETMTEAGLDLLPVKGSWLKEAYPQIHFRQMSDLDILIRREDRAKARALMLELGFAEEAEETASHHDSYEKKPYTAVELHLQLLPSDDRHCGYYQDIWEKALPVEDMPRLYRLRPEDEYIFYFLHMKHHLEEAGCGIRSILDSVVFRNTYPNMDQTYLGREFEELEIADFTEKVEQLADCWFVTGDPVPDALTEMAGSILGSGVYGQLDNAFRNRMDILKKKYKNPVVVMAAYWSSRFFRPMSEMKNDYPVLEKQPFLLPVFWIVRIVRKCIIKPAALLYHVKQIFKEGAKNG